VANQRRSRAPTQQRRSPRQRTGWTSSTLFGNTLADGGATVVDLLGAFTVGEKFRIGTILRILCQLTTRSSSAGARSAGRWGIIKVTDDALAVPTVPLPISDLENDWMINNWHGQEDAANLPVVQTVDLRSKRKLGGDGQTLAFVIESDGAASGATTVFTMAFRILYAIK